MANSSLRPATRVALWSSVVDSLRQAIFSGALVPGARLNEVDLANDLGVSRGPLREALHQLEAEGIVRQEMHKGASVTVLSEEDVREIESLRIQLELFALSLAIRNSTPDDIERLGAIVDAIQGAIERGDLAGAGQADVDFHAAVVEAAHHSRLKVAWRSIEAQTRLLLATRVHDSESYTSVAVDEHREILDCIVSGDSATARELVTGHIRGSFRSLMRMFGLDAADEEIG